MKFRQRATNGTSVPMMAWISWEGVWDIHERGVKRSSLISDETLTFVFGWVGIWINPGSGMDCIDLIFSGCTSGISGGMAGYWVRTLKWLGIGFGLFTCNDEIRWIC